MTRIYASLLDEPYFGPVMLHFVEDETDIIWGRGVCLPDAWLQLAEGLKDRLAVEAIRGYLLWPRTGLPAAFYRELVS